MVADLLRIASSRIDTKPPRNTFSMCRSPRQEDLSDSKNLAFLRVPSPAWPLRSRNSVQWPPATTYFQAFEVYERPGLTDLLQLTHQRGQPMAATASQAQLPLLPTTEGNDLP